jgi:RND family efflux transporter MFP subunit
VKLGGPGTGRKCRAHFLDDGYAYATIYRGEKMRTIFFSAGAVVALAALAACSNGEGAKGPQGPAVQVAAVKAVKQEMPSADAYVGNIRSRQAVTISTKMMGRVQRIAVEEGQAVKKGQLLAEVDAAEAQSAFLQSKAGRSAADVALQNAQRDYERFKALYAEKAVTKHQLEQAEMGLAAAKAQKEQAEANLGLSSTLLSYGKIVAPGDGIITRKWMDAGNLAYPGAPILTLENPNDLELSVQVPEEKARALSAGQSAFVTVDAVGKSFEAKITAAVTAADPVTRTATVKLAIPENAGVLPGQFASVRFAAFTQQALAIPSSALVERGQMDGVFVVADGAARLRYVQAGLKAKGLVQILSGLDEGEMVIAPVPDGLADGARVSVAQ